MRLETRHSSPRRASWLAVATLAVAAGSASWLVPAASARVLVTRDEALRQIFGEDAAVAVRTAYLTRAQIHQVRQRARAPFDGARVTYYVATAGDSLLGTAFIDRHVVRTMSATVLIALEPDGAIRAIEILAWNEPDDYRPSSRWLEHAQGLSDPRRALSGDALPHLAGATLTARALTAAARRALALREVILAPPAPR